MATTAYGILSRATLHKKYRDKTFVLTFATAYALRVSIIQLIKYYFKNFLYFLEIERLARTRGTPSN